MVKRLLGHHGFSWADGKPVKQSNITVDKTSGNALKYTIEMRENDVYLVKLKPVS
jgi:hypothetical protein